MRAARGICGFVVLALAFALAPAAARPAPSGSTVVREKDLNLTISARLVEDLRAAGIGVFETRDTDVTLQPWQRTGLANRNNVDAFISMHNNAGRPSVSGSDVFHSMRHDGSWSLGDDVRAALRARFGPSRRAALRARASRFGRDYYFQLRQTRMPAILVEGAFVTNEQERQKLASEDPTFRNTIADSVSDGIQMWQRSLVRAPLRAMNPGTTVPAPLPPPLDGSISALSRNRVHLAFDTSPLVRIYRLYRDGSLIAVFNTNAPRISYTDEAAAPGQTYVYEARAAVGIGGAWGESLSLTLRATTPAINVVIDPGHGGADSGASARL